MAKRLTQKDIARLAGVSQATVSLVLNGPPGAACRIPDETRDAGPEGDPRDRLCRRSGRPPHGQGPQPHPGRLHLRAGLSQRPGRLLRAVPVRHRGGGAGAGLRPAAADGGGARTGRAARRFSTRQPAAPRRRLHRARARISTATNSTASSSGDFPFVAVGRRDDAGGPVPYVGADYATATADLVRARSSAGTGRSPMSARARARNRRVDRWTRICQCARRRARSWPAHSRRRASEPRRRLRRDARKRAPPSCSSPNWPTPSRSSGPRLAAGPRGARRSLDRRAGQPHPARAHRAPRSPPSRSRARRWRATRHAGARRPARRQCRESSRCCSPANRSRAKPSAPSNDQETIE